MPPDGEKYWTRQKHRLKNAGKNLVWKTDVIFKNTLRALKIILSKIAEKAYALVKIAGDKNNLEKCYAFSW